MLRDEIEKEWRSNMRDEKNQRRMKLKKINFINHFKKKIIKRIGMKYKGKTN